MGALVGLGVGVGLMLVWSAFFVPRRAVPATRRSGRLTGLLARAGLGQVAVNGFVVLCLALGGSVALLLQVVSGAPPVALVFGVIGGLLPVAVVSGRARRRQREDHGAAGCRVVADHVGAERHEEQDDPGRGDGEPGAVDGPRLSRLHLGIPEPKAWVAGYSGEHSRPDCRFWRPAENNWRSQHAGAVTRARSRLGIVFA